MSNSICVISLQVDWASQAYCNFTIFVAVIMFVISLGQFVRFLKFFYKGRDSSFLSAFVDVIVCVFMCTMTLTAALFVTLGFKIWCEVCTLLGKFAQEVANFQYSNLLYTAIVRNRNACTERVYL